MTTRLLDRQTRLLEYLTSGDAIFGEGTSPLHPTLQGIDRTRLHLEARFSYEKRMEKIAAVFPKTFALLGASVNEIVRQFATEYPPVDISWVENARQFYDFLMAQCKKAPAAPHLLDVAACEFGCARVRVASSSVSEPPQSPTQVAGPGLRRNRGVVLLRTRYDVRPIFEGDDASISPTKRLTLLAITMREHDTTILEIAPELFDLLMALDTSLGMDEFEGAEDLVASLADVGLVEVLR